MRMCLVICPGELLLLCLPWSLRIASAVPTMSKARNRIEGRSNGHGAYGVEAPLRSGEKGIALQFGRLMSQEWPTLLIEALHGDTPQQGTCVLHSHSLRSVTWPHGHDWRPPPPPATSRRRPISVGRSSVESSHGSAHVAPSCTFVKVVHQHN